MPELLLTLTDFCERPRPYLDRVGRGESFRLRGHGGPFSLTRNGLASGRPVVKKLGSKGLAAQQGAIGEALRKGGVVQITRWGVVDGVLEVV